MRPPAKGRPKPVAAKNLEAAQSAAEHRSPLSLGKGSGDRPS